MRTADFLRSLAYPVACKTVLPAFLLFYVAAEFMRWAISTGPFYFVSATVFAVFLLPALCLYLVYLLQARARGREPDPPGIEHLLWFGSGWSLLQVLYFVAIGYGTVTLAGTTGMAAVVAVAAVVLPASLATLAVTQSPLESLNPVTLRKVIARCGWRYWLVTLYFVVAVAVTRYVYTSGITPWLADLVSLYLLFVFYALTGAVIRPGNLHRDVDIYEPLQPDESAIAAELLSVRNDVLNHAYGFISRGNREGGLQHIRDWIAEDPEPGSAWRWYFDNMMRWQDKMPALFFGQHYVRRLLHDGDFRAATRVIMRCRHENEAFQPFREDREQAIAAAEHVGNEELARALRAGMSGSDAVEVVRRS